MKKLFITIGAAIECSMGAFADMVDSATYVNNPWDVKASGYCKEAGNAAVRAVTIAGSGVRSIFFDGEGTLSLGGLATCPSSWLYFMSDPIGITLADGDLVRMATPQPADDDFDLTAAIHLDASDAGTLTLGETDEVTGNRFIKGVADVREPSVTVATAGATDDVLVATYPTLKPDALNGRPVFDMGEFAMQATEVRHCGYLSFSQINACEGFMVVRYKNGGKDSAFSLGYVGGDCYRFHRGTGDNGEGLNNCQILSSQYAYAYGKGDWFVDGIRIPEWCFVPDDQFHLISFALPRDDVGAQYWCNTISCDRNARCGGVELAELVLFTDNLTPEQRQQIEVRLMNKWFGEGSHAMARAWDLSTLRYQGEATPAFDVGAPVNVKQLSGGNVFTKAGPARLEVGNLIGFSGLAVNAGELSIANAYPEALGKAAAHYDFSNADSLRFDEEHEDEILHADDLGSGVYPVSVYSYSNGNPKWAPLGNTGLNGIDFGPYEIIAGKTKADAEGASAMLVDNDSYVAGAKTAFIVVSGDFANVYEHLLGSTGAYHYNRDCASFVDIEYAESSLRNATWYIDGVPAESATATPIPGGLQVIAYRTNSDGYGGDVNLICADRSTRLGGFKYGEIILYQEKLTDEEMTAINNYLVAKWKGGATYTASYDEISVQKNATIDFGCGVALADDSSFTIGYPFASEPISVSGALALGTNVTLTVTAETAAKVATGIYTVISADSVMDARNIRTWTVQGSACEGKMVKPFVEDGCLKLDIGPAGMIILIR